MKETCIEDGRLYHAKIPEIWEAYDLSLHKWMLKLTEEFDLTFPVPEKKMNIVPCLLPEKEPKYDWPEMNENNPLKIREFKVSYSFDYLPTGLFNRIQVRLFQYGDSSIIWKKGSLLRKNNHIALIQIKNALSIQIKVQGVRPENIIFVIHEVIETLVNESFNGLKYDFSFPCPECVDALSAEPCLFSSSLLRRASELKAPFLQCNKYFHAISIQEMLAIMPMDDNISNLDLNLQNSIRDLKQIKLNLKYDIMFWYCDKDVPSEGQKNSCNPLDVVEAIKKCNFKFWYSQNPATEKLDQITYAIKESKILILGLSDNFSNDEKCVQIFQLVKNIIKKII